VDEQSDGVAWEASLDQARRRACAEGKALLLDFQAGPAADVAAGARTFREPRVASFIEEHFVPVKVIIAGPPVVAVGGGGDEVHYSVDVLLPPDEFVAQLSLGLGRYHFDLDEFAEAARCFEDVVARRRGTPTAAQALFWLGIARYNQSLGGPGPRPSARWPSHHGDSVHE
jgi:hypothetical protein